MAGCQSRASCTAARCAQSRVARIRKPRRSLALSAAVRRAGLPVGAIVNSALYDHCPEVIDAFVQRYDELIAHGHTNSERQAALPENEEPALIHHCRNCMARAHGSVPAGWLSSWISESNITPDLLQGAGLRYTLNWRHVDQPARRQTNAGCIWFVPDPREVNDIPMIVGRRMDGKDLAQLIIVQFDEMLLQSREQSLVMGIALHPTWSASTIACSTCAEAAAHQRAPHGSRRTRTYGSPRPAAYCRLLGLPGQRHNASALLFLISFVGPITLTPMPRIKITAAGHTFIAETHPDAPITVAAFMKLLPYRQKIIHVRWSGEGCWIPLGDFKLGADFENHTSHPSVGDILFYPGGYSETEIILAYGACCFASKMGQLAGNHFLTIVEGKEELRALGTHVLWQGAQDIVFEAI